MAERLTMLDLRCAELYPEIPAGVWLNAWRTAMRRAEGVWFEHGSAALVAERLLCDEHFRFRGGEPRAPGAPEVFQRLSDRPVSKSNEGDSVSW
jgi:hypothetical protein